MSTRTMKHPGTVTTKEPAVTTKYFDSELNRYIEEVVSPEREVTIKLQAGSTYGGLAIGRNVQVPDRLQSAAYARGFRFTKPEDEEAFKKEEAARVEKREAIKKAEAEAKAKEEAAKAKADSKPAEGGN